jgi:hypothetical protein
MKKPYNYFRCRTLHVRLEGVGWDGIAVKPDPYKVAARQPNNLPGVFACPKCPICGKTMEFYDSGYGKTPLPFAPPPPNANELALPNLSRNDIPVYSGSGVNKGHPPVTWEITRNAAQMDITIKIMRGVRPFWSSVQEFKLIDRLLDTTQNAVSKEDWWLKAPVSPGNDMELWHSFSLDALIGQARPANLGTLPATIQIGVQLGTSAWGLIHLLAEHAQAVRNVGPYEIQATGNNKVDVYRTMLSLQSGMQRFDNASITHIYHDQANNKLVIKGSNAGKIVVTQKNKVMNGSPVYSVTTIYNDDKASGGVEIYRR